LNPLINLCIEASGSEILVSFPHWNDKSAYHPISFRTEITGHVISSESGQVTGHYPIRHIFREVWIPRFVWTDW